MSISDPFSPRGPRAMSMTSALTEGIAGVTQQSKPVTTAAPDSWPWRPGALFFSVVAQVITIAALSSADPIPATWAALLLAVAPAPLALVAAFAPAPAARIAAPVAVVVLLVGIIAQITHTGLFFLPALATMAVAALRLWRE
jgi:hypothetical protein